STQVSHEVQEFAWGAAIMIPPHARVIATVHLVNSGEAAVSVPLGLTIFPIPETEVRSVLHGFAMENLSIALPPHEMSRFTVECDLAPTWKNLYNAGQVASDHIDFKIYHSLS